MVAEPKNTTGSTPRKRMGWGKRILIALLVLVLLIAVAIGALLIFKPWYQAPTVSEPAPSGRVVTEAGLLAHYYPVADGGKHPAVLVVGGSEGGLSPLLDRTAVALQKEGFNALALSYWGGPGQPESMDALPLETFTGALDWLEKQPEVDAKKLAFVGTSKGGEAGVLMASRTPRLRATVAYVPSHVVWAGLNLKEPWAQGTIGSTWSEKGQPLPYLPYTNEYRGGPLVDLYNLSLKALPEHADAIIPVEKASGDLLLVCGEADMMWPSCAMSREVKKRADANNGPEVTVLAYPDAGHFLSGPPPEADFPIDITQMGGTPEGMKKAYTDSWPKVLAFLKKATA